MMYEVFYGINTKNVQPGFISSCENLIGINQIKQQEFTQSKTIEIFILYIGRIRFVINRPRKGKRIIKRKEIN